jgi:hypothetical protein
MTMVHDKKTKAAELAREGAKKEASKKKALVKPGADVGEQEAALATQKAPESAKPKVAEKKPDPKVTAAKEDAAKKAPPPAEEIVKDAAVAEQKKTDFWKPISKLVAAAESAANPKSGMKEAEMDKHLAAGRELFAKPELKVQSFSNWCDVRDAILKIEQAKEALKAPPPPEEAVEEVVAEAENKELPAEAAAGVAATAESLMAGANAAQAEKLSDAAQKSGKKSLAGG